MNAAAEDPREETFPRGHQPAACEAHRPLCLIYATSSRHSRSIPREDLFPCAYAYSGSARIIAGSYAGRPCPSAR
jgi:hypothetical protein